ncbi:MAG: hypothetical protein IJ792_03955 [Oscillospiraceae bacterium]|nr:hypothetical protein [Oscillospiraceae bacterium]
MKRILALLLGICMLLPLVACGGNTPVATDTDSAVATDTDNPESEPAETEEAEQAEQVEQVVYGQITGIPAPEGWVISDRSADNYLIYVQVTEAFEESEYWCPYLQFGFEDYESPEQTFADRLEMYDNDGLTYTTEDVTIAGIDFHKVIPDLGEIQLYGEVDGVTLIITHNKDLDETDANAIQIIENIHILPEA